MRPIKSLARHTRPAGLGAVALWGMAALAVTGCGSGSSSSASSSSAAPASLTVWRMGASTPAQVTWMNGVVSQFHKAYPGYAKTKVKVVWVPWTNATTEFTDALSSGKNAPDITEIGNTETPTNTSLGMLANITSDVDAWSNKPDIVPRHAGQRHPERQHLRCAVVRRRPGHLVKHRSVQGSQLKGGAYSGSQVMSGFANAATVTQISPLNAKELGHRGHHGSDHSHDDEVADAGRQLHRYR